VGATKTPKYGKMFESIERTRAFLDDASLGQMLGFYRYLHDHLQTDPTDDLSPMDVYDLREQVGGMILTEMMGRHRRIDHREHWVMVEYLSHLGFEVVHLKTGEGDMKTERVAIERKEDDFLPSLFDGRSLRQLSAMREASEFSYLLVTKSFQQVKEGALKQGVSEATLLSFVASLCAVGYPPIFIEGKHDAASLIHRIVGKIEDDKHRLYVPRPASPQVLDYRNALIEGLPNIGPKLRRRIIAIYPSISSLCEATIEDLTNIEGVGKTTAERIISVLNSA